MTIPEGEVQRLSIGDRTVWERPNTYTNLVPTATDKDGNIIGCQNGVYLSSTDWDTVTSDAACVTTGYMPFAYTANDGMPTVYVKGVTIDTSKSHVRGCFYNASKSPAWAWASSTRANVEVEQLGDRYYKLTLTQTRLNLGYMRFSFLGTGENLIVTVDEPIE